MSLTNFPCYLHFRSSRSSPVSFRLDKLDSSVVLLQSKLYKVNCNVHFRKTFLKEKRGAFYYAMLTHPSVIECKIDVQSSCYYFK